MTKNDLTLSAAKLYERIRSSLDEADRICLHWDHTGVTSNDEDRELIQANIECAFEQTLMLMEQLHLPEARSRVQDLFQTAKNKLDETIYSSSMGELYLVWSYKLWQILSAVENSEARSLEPLVSIQGILDGFHNVALSLQRDRHAGRPQISINDEYDVQYLLEAFLRGTFSDVRAEEVTPSYAGKSSKIDFLLYADSIAIEVKMTRTDLKDKDVSRQLIIDKDEYLKHPRCRTLICFVYDPGYFLKNPAALSDLADDPRLSVHVYVRPAR